MINFLLLAILIGVTYFVANEGPQGAAISLFAVILAGLIAMNFFEPLAEFIASSLGNSFEWQNRSDIIAMLLLFAGGVTLIRLMGDHLFPTYAEVTPMFYEVSRWGLGLFTGYITMAILLTSLHVAPLPREFIGFTPEGNNFLSITAPDREWLAFTQYVSEKSMKRSGNRIFDGAEFPSNPTEVSTQRIWASFPIRYAARRELYTTGGRAPVQSGPPPISQPQQGGGAPSGGAVGF
ncbi:CvpA family protein [Thalassoglobus sp.]|uniref:CvpA family protein n=1 Tax=Thalassoglobus sp. TaxID=2795869 RepID=UPI003AA7AE3E